MAGRIQQLINGHRDLTNAVSHELRTPLARMRFGLEMLEKTQKQAKISVI
jgi:signal transduction histidine kinase